MNLFTLPFIIGIAKAFMNGITVAYKNDSENTGKHAGSHTLFLTSVKEICCFERKVLKKLCAHTVFCNFASEIKKIAKG